MKERDKLRQLRRYKFVLIRVRLPGNYLLQAIFRSGEKLQLVYELLLEYLEFDYIPFALYGPDGSRLEESDYEHSLAELDLAPAAVLTLQFDAAVVAEVQRASPSIALDQCVAADLMAKLQIL